MGRQKIGAVSYLNTKPLVAGLDEPNSYEVTFDLPSRLADRLADDQLDVALIPVIEAVTGNYTIVSDACIGCRGQVWSVKLMSRVPFPEIKTLSLDEGSRTSCALTRVMLDSQFRVRPECRPLSINDDWRLVQEDAVLIIGDRAMKADSTDFPHVWDLGQAWFDWTGKPFVFAVWAARENSDHQQLSHALSAARDLGVSQIDEISSQFASSYGLTDDECLRYLRDHLRFHLGDDEKSALDLYFQHAAKLALIPDTLRLQFHDCQTA